MTTVGQVGQLRRGKTNLVARIGSIPNYSLKRKLLFRHCSSFLYRLGSATTLLLGFESRNVGGTVQ